MHTKRCKFPSVLLTVILSLSSSLGALTGPIPTTFQRVPSDSILVVSVDGEKLISKSGILKNNRWDPLFQRLENFGIPLRSILSDSNSSGIDWKEPIQFFVRLAEGENPHPQFGAIARAKYPERADQAMSSLARYLGLRPTKQNPQVYQRTTQPFAIGREGNFCFLLGTLLLQKDSQIASPTAGLEKFLSTLAPSYQLPGMPAPLSKHAQHTSDVALYIEGTGNSRMLESWKGNTLLESLFPLFDPLLLDSFGMHIRSQPGNLQIGLRNYSEEKNAAPTKVSPLNMVDQLPGDAPVVARLSLPENGFHRFLAQASDRVLKFFSGNQLSTDSQLPGFNLSARELISFPTGDFVFAGGSYRTIYTPMPNGQSLPQTRPVWATGMNISRPFAFLELLSGLNQGMGLPALLDAHDLHLHHDQHTAWLSTPEYAREISLGRPIEPLSFRRRQLLNNHELAIDFNPRAAALSLRKPENLSFDQLKKISWLDLFSNFNLKSKANGNVQGTLTLSQPDTHPWSVLADRLAQELIDQINARLFLAIAQDDLNAVVEAVALGALINANDRFGHSPLHYAAYRGNAFIVDYLLSNGGNPNARGNHLSTPLHSAAWGKHQDVIELLLEDGAEVNAQTDERESPVMTATLRGQLEIVEILLALSADPHAVDAYGSNLMDLAGASGNTKLVELFQEVGVKTLNPLHLAAGTGDFKTVENLLQAGRSINEQDSFGATPLLVATVAGREDMVDFLLDRSADPLIEAKDGYSLLHGAAFSGKKSLVRKMLGFGHEVNQRYGPDKITPTDVGEEGSEGLIYLRSMGGRSAWELGPE
jgi:ankyrin repeat protein